MVKNESLYIEKKSVLFANKMLLAGGYFNEAGGNSKQTILFWPHMYTCTGNWSDIRW